MKSGKRIVLLALIQVFGCICVVFGHSYPFVTPIPGVFLHLRSFIYSFHMPLFVFCSGVLLQISRSTDKYSFWQFLKKRSLRLLLPYFVFSLLGIVPKILLSPVLNDSLSLDAMELLRAFLVPRENIWGHFWFLPMIFFCGLIGYWLSRLFRALPWTRWAVLLVTFFALYLPELSSWLGADDLIGNLFYFVLGMVCSGLFLRDRFTGSLKPYCFSAGLLMISAAVFFMGASLQISSYVAPVIACTMIAACALGLLPLSHRISVNKGSLLSRSYSVFILSWPCQLVVELVLGLSFWCIMPCMFTVGLVLPCMLILLINRLEKNKRYQVLSRIIGG